jgi:DNA replication and repair protein RecF
MQIEKLVLKNFRNYKNEEVTFEKESNLFFGKNGQGKTNILEAIHFLTVGKSFRTNNDSKLINSESERNYFSGTFCRNDGNIFIECEISKTGKEFKINHIKRQRSEVISQIGVITFVPEDKMIITGEPEKRRNFIDSEIMLERPLYYDTLLRYRKCLKNRNILLKEKRKKEEILFWQNYLFEYGAEIIKKRSEKINKLKEEAKKIYKKLTGDDLEINYKPSIEKRENNEEQVKLFEKYFEQNYERDFERGQTEKGPHRDELEIIINGKETKDFASQGQKKMAAIVLKLAGKNIYEREKKEKPIVLLDDIFSELDSEKKEKIISEIKENQYIVTTTECENGFQQTKEIKEGRIL